MEDAKDQGSRMQYVSRFRVETSHFTVDLGTQLRAFPADVFLSLDPNPEFSGLLEGFKLARERDGQWVQLDMDSCLLMFVVDEGSEIDANMLKFWFAQIAEMRLRRVLVTEPRNCPQPLVFISNLVEAGLEFLQQVSRSEIVFSTSESALYEHAFNILARYQKPTFDEGNGILDDNELLRAFYREVQCKLCGRLSLRLYYLRCCGRTRCEECSRPNPNTCMQCNAICNPMMIQFVSRVLGDVEVACACGNSMKWKDFAVHSQNCEKVGIVCRHCSKSLPRKALFDHYLEEHEAVLFEKHSEPMNAREVSILTSMQAPQQPKASSNSWQCQVCQNVNSDSQFACIRCQTPMIT